MEPTRPTPTGHDVVVVGAGPAGASAAVWLGRAGLDVVVVDKARFPRDKICGDGLTTWALRELDRLGLDPSRVASWRAVDAAEVSSPSRACFAFPLPSSVDPGAGMFAAIARRKDLDATVVDLARNAGADVREGQAVTGVRQGGDQVEIDVAGPDGVATLQCRYLVAADGMWSPVRKALGVGEAGYRGEWHAFRQYFVDVDGPAADRLLVWFEPDFLPGYAWSFPLDGPTRAGVANVGFGIERDAGWRTGAMGSLWAEILARPHIRAALGPAARPEGPPRAWPIPTRVGVSPASVGRVLFAGDAVAAADPLTGEGIGQALATGRWAAEAVLTDGRPGQGAPDRVAARYAGHIDDLALDHRLSQLLVRAMSHRKGARAALRVAGLSGWTRRNFARWLFEDYPRAVLATPHRWHRGRLRGPGAFRP